MEKKKVYTCAICGKEYESIPERTKCEGVCVDKQIKLEEKAKKEKKKQEQETRRLEIIKTLKCARTLLTDYINDYGSFEYDSTEEADDECEAETKSETTTEELWPFGNWPIVSKWMHYFW